MSESQIDQSQPVPEDENTPTSFPVPGVGRTEAIPLTPEVDMGLDPVSGSLAEPDQYMDDAISGRGLGLTETSENSYKSSIDFLLSGGSAQASVQQSADRIDSLSRELVVRTTEAKLATGVLDAEGVKDLAARYDRPKYQDALKSMYAVLDGSDSSGGLDSSDSPGLSGKRIDKAASVVDSENYTSEEVSQVVKEFRAELERGSLTTALLDNESSLLDKNLKVAKAGLQVVEGLVSPTYYQTMGNVISDVFPDLNLVDRTQMGSTIQEVGKRIREARPAQQTALMKGLIKSIRNRAGDLTDNQYLMGQMLDQIETAVNGGYSKPWEIVDNLFTVGEAVPVLGSVAKGVRALKSMALTKGSVASIASKTVRGTEILTEMSKSENAAAALKGMGTTVDQVINDLLLPKLSGAPVAKGPFLESIYFKKEHLDLIQAEYKTSMDAWGKGQFSTRLKDVVVTPVDGGFEASLSLGTKTGGGFQSQRSAERFADQVFNKGSYEVEEVGGEFFAKIKDKKYLDLVDAEKFGLETTQVFSRGLIGKLKGLLGKSNRFDDHINSSGTVATVLTAKARSDLIKTLEPYTNLYGETKEKVQHLLMKGDRDGVDFSSNDLRAFGLNDEGVAGFQAVRATLDKAHDIKNFTMWNKMKADGYRSAKFGQELILLKPVQQLNKKSGSILNLDTGKVTQGSGVTAKTHDFFRVINSDGNVVSAYAKKGSGAHRDIPRQVLKKPAGYLPRYYNSPYFVRKQVGFLADGKTPRFSTIKTAGSEADAAAYVEKMKAVDPGNAYSVRLANELDDADMIDADDVLQMDAQGLLYSSSRKPEMLDDVNGVPNLASFDDSLGRAINSGANSAGIARWHMTMQRQWDAAFGDKFGKFNSFKKPAQLDTADQKDYEAALALWDHINMAAGIHPADLSRTIQGLRVNIGDIFLNSASYLNRLTGPSGVARTAVSPVSGTLGFLGREFTGVTNKTMNALKSAATVAYLITNPARMWILQTSMLPIYAGIEGAAKYMGTGRFFKDMMLLTAQEVDASLIEKTAKAMKMKKGEAEETLKAWNDSGIRELVDSHSFTIGSMTNARLSSTSYVGGKLIKAIDTLKAIGLDGAVLADKKATWLVSLNKFRTANKRIPANRTEWQEVTAFAEKLSLNQNPSDNLISSKSALSVFTQFQSHKIKMTGRLLGMEKGFSAKEKLNMQVFGLISYGTAGYGASNLVERVFREAGWIDPDQELYQVVEQGIVGTMMSGLFSLMDDPEKATKLAYSEEVSPMNAGLVGLTPDTVMKVFEGSFNLGNSAKNLVELNAPAFGVVGGLYDAAKFAYSLVGVDQVEPLERGAVAANNFLTKFPIYSQGFKAIVGSRIGAVVDTKGSPVVEAAVGELLGKGLFGIDSRDEVRYREAVSTYMGEYASKNETAVNKEIADSAKKYARDVLVPLLNSLGEEGNNLEMISEIVTGHNTLIRLGLTEAQAFNYYDIIQREIDKSKIFQNERFKDGLFEDLMKGRVVDNARVRAAIQLAPGKPEQKAQLNRVLDSLTEFHKDADYEQSEDK